VWGLHRGVELPALNAGEKRERWAEEEEKGEGMRSRPVLLQGASAREEGAMVRSGARAPAMEESRASAAMGGAPAGRHGKAGAWAPWLLVAPCCCRGKQGSLPWRACRRKRSRGAAFGTCAKGREAGKIWAPWVEEAPCAGCCCREQRGRRQGVWLVAAREKMEGGSAKLPICKGERCYL
jgi:hypothetical protein